MAQITFTILLLLTIAAVFTPEPTQGSVIPASGIAEGLKNNQSQLKYIGSFSTPLKIRGIIRQQTSYYFLSQNAAGYTTADNDCKANLGDDSGLASIETQEELANVTRFLKENDDTGSNYWLGGQYDVASSKFVWESGAELGPWAPWDHGHPDTRTPITRVFASTIVNMKLRTQFNTVSTRYICELKTGQPEEEAEPCYNDNDLMIVVDSSGSIGQTHYMVALEFTTRLAIAWADNPRNRLSVIIYSNYVQSIITLPQNFTVSEIRDLVNSSPYFGGGTDSELGLRTALQEFQQNPRSVPQNLVFLTDGVSNDPSATIAAAQQIQAAEIRSFSVGIGGSIAPDELLAISGNNPDHVFNTSGFEDLLKLLQPVSRRVCNE